MYMLKGRLPWERDTNVDVQSRCVLLSFSPFATGGFRTLKLQTVS